MFAAWRLYGKVPNRGQYSRVGPTTLKNPRGDLLRPGFVLGQELNANSKRSLSLCDNKKEQTPQIL